VQIKENTNRAIAFNSAVLYVRLGLTTILGLFTTRYTLQALGVDDFGLFSLLASVISFVSIINTIMVATTNRFLAVAIGKNDIEEANEQFVINLNIHLVIAILTLVLLTPLGELYIRGHLNYSGSLDVAIMVFRITMVGSAFSFISIPYNGLLMAKERFIVFSITEVISHFIRLVVVILLLFYFEQKLIIYTCMTSILTAMPLLIYVVYSTRHFHEIVKYRKVKNRAKYREVFAFSGWVGYGAIATVGKNQGAAVIVNLFFNTAMNTALGLANSVHTYIMLFAQNMTKPISPQITKSYAAGDMERCKTLMISSSKYSFLLMLIISSPFLINSEWVLHLWLGNVPPFAAQFTLLMVIDALLDSLNPGIGEVIFASGKIKAFQLTINTLRLLAVVCAYFVLRTGAPVQFLLYSYILFTILAFFARQVVLRKTLDFDNKVLIKGSYLPSLFVFIGFLPVLIIKTNVPVALYMTISVIYLMVLIFFIGLSNVERSFILNKLQRKK
jgi:O-antigen/teichoic acid export membrane protein